MAITTMTMQFMNHSLKGVVSIVAGLMQRLEIEIIRRLLIEDAIVIVPASNVDTILQIKNEVADITTGSLVTLINDPLDYDRSRDITDHIQRNYGSIDLVIVLSNKVYSPLPLTELDYTVWDSMQCDSLSYCFMSARLILPLMKHHRRGTFIQVCNDLSEGAHGVSPLDRIAHTVQSEVSKILDDEVSMHGVRYFHVFSDNDRKANRINEATYIIGLFKERNSLIKELFHKASGDGVVNAAASNLN